MGIPLLWILLPTAENSNTQISFLTVDSLTNPSSTPDIRATIEKSLLPGQMPQTSQQGLATLPQRLILKSWPRR
jgi:hypothetical protein